MNDRVQLTVIAPCLNEAGNLPELAQRVIAAFGRKSLRGELVLVNDGSTDQSRDVIETLEAIHPQLRSVHHAENCGIAAAWKSGLKAARGEFVCLIDSDLQYQPEDLCRLWDEVQRTGADMAQGWRSEIGRPLDPRYYYSRMLNWLLNRCFGMRLRDNKSGFVLCRRDALEDILRHRLRYRYFQTFIAVAAHRKGYSVCEIEVLFQQRKVGKSFISAFPLRVIGGALLDLVTGWIEYRWLESNHSVESDFLTEHAPLRNEETLQGWRKRFFQLYVATMPLHHWTIGRRAASHYEDLKKTQWLSPQDVRRLQERKLRRLIHHAYHHVKYYREIFDRLGLKPTDIRGVEDLRKLPLLDKPTIRANLHFNLMSDNHDKRKVVAIQTSGSTGEPFTFYVDQSQLEMRWAATQRSVEWTGYRFGDRQARLWHQTIGMRPSQVIRERIAAWFNRRLFIPAFAMTEANLPRAIRKLERFKPVLVDGYAESFNFLARYIKFHGLPAFQPTGIISSAQILPDSCRQTLEETFACGVFDKYGSREFSGIAYECDAHDGKHLVAENYIVEILNGGRPARPGEMGEVVITDLNNYCMPFIRYRIGDLAVAMDPSAVCRCGRGLPRIGRIEGRVQSLIVTADGRYLPGSFFPHFFKDYDYAVHQYQVVQESASRLRLKIVKAMRFDEDTFATILKRLRPFVGEQMQIEVEFVDQIPMVRTGKVHGSISNLGFDFQKLHAETTA